MGIVIGTLCWRATRPIAGLQDDPGTELDIHFGAGFLTVWLLLGVVSFGAMALGFWMHTRRWPKRMDLEGMTLRNGKRLPWKQITSITKGVKTLGGVPVNVWWQLQAGKVRAEIVPRSLAEGRAALQFASRALGRQLTVD